MKANNHKRTLLKIMLEQGRVTAGRVFGISNANQYLGELKREGAIKDRWTQEDGRRFKWWYIVDFDKAEKKIGDWATKRRKLRIRPIKIKSKYLRAASIKRNRPLEIKTWKYYLTLAKFWLKPQTFISTQSAQAFLKTP